MGIGYRIKEARERLGLTQTELGRLVGVTGSAITNYEKGTSHPKEQVIYKLMECLNVDANFLFQDVVRTTKKEADITFKEFDHIKKYRALNSHGREVVDFVLESEYRNSIKTAAVCESSIYMLNAAHERTDIEVTKEMKQHDEDIMDDENF